MDDDEDDNDDDDEDGDNEELRIPMAMYRRPMAS